MNKERMLQLADFIENTVTDQRFSMAHFGDNCETTHCIGGWVNVLFTGKAYDPSWAEEDFPGEGSWAGAARKAQQLLDLSDSQANDLFFDWPDNRMYDRLDAVRRIREMAETGKWTQPRQTR